MKLIEAFLNLKIKAENEHYSIIPECFGLITDFSNDASNEKFGLIGLRYDPIEKKYTISFNLCNIGFDQAKGEIRSILEFKHSDIFVSSKHKQKHENIKITDPVFKFLSSRIALDQVNFQHYDISDFINEMSYKEYLPLLFPSLGLIEDFVEYKKEIFKINLGYDIDQLNNDVITPIIHRIEMNERLGVYDFYEVYRNANTRTNLECKFWKYASAYHQTKQFNKLEYSDVFEKFYLTK